MSLRNRLTLICGAALVMTAACGGDDPPGRLSDPAAVSAELSAVLSVFEAPVIESFHAFTGVMPPSAAAAAPGIVAATAPNAPDTGQPAAVRSAEQARALAALAPVLTAPQDSFLPDSVLGTYEWDAAGDRYVKTARAGAPPNTVRFILYLVDAAGTVIEPVTEVGYVDLTDNQFVGAGASLGVVVRDAAGTTTYVDYDITVTANPSGFGANATGVVRDGTGRELGFAVQFLATGDETQGTVSVAGSFDVNTPNVLIEIHDAASVSGTTITLNRDFRVERPGETIRLTGTVTVTQSQPGAFSITFSTTVTVNGRVYVTIQGTVTTGGSNFTVTKADGSQPTAAELEALGTLLEAADEFFADVGHLFQPGEVLAGG